jgi:hypothetical protein
LSHCAIFESRCACVRARRDDQDIFENDLWNDKMNHDASVEHKINQNSRPMTVENLAVFGATGQTGQHVVEYALEIGWNVRALARDATKLKLKHDNLPLFQVTFFTWRRHPRDSARCDTHHLLSGRSPQTKGLRKGHYGEICARAPVAGSPTSQTEILSLLSSENLVQSPQFSLS